MNSKKHELPQRKIGTALRDFFGHVTSHDEEGVHAAICMVANENSTEVDEAPTTGMHICSFNAGDPEILAQMMLMSIDTMIEEIPGFAEAWEAVLRAKRLQAMIQQVVDVVKEAKEQAAETKGMEAAKPAVDALIEKLKGNPGAVPGPDTKQ